MTFPKPGRPSKGLITCFFCKTGCSPKNGDWFFSVKATGQQIFSCRGCERGIKGDYKPAVPLRRMEN